MGQAMTYVWALLPGDLKHLTLSSLYPCYSRQPHERPRNGRSQPQPRPIKPQPAFSQDPRRSVRVLKVEKPCFRYQLE